MSAPSKIGVILGSGLGAFADTLENRVEKPYSDIPGWPVSTAKGHAGKLVAGQLDGVDVIVAAGRAHLYEGYTAQQVAYPIRELAWRGVTSLVITNAAGGINLSYKPGNLVLISDHINLMGVNPLSGPEFIDMSEAYSSAYRAIASEAAARLGMTLKEGVYAGLPGPSYETPAEIRYLRTIGADLVGMSTVPEVIAANHLGIPVLGISCVTNMAAGILPQKLSHSEVMETGERVKDTVAALLRTVIPHLR
ncbi:MAG TPA: purine-nucleoside phosphorylase [Bryobacteraceae bacterium]|jgi:purine-nucleoside phosphorylase|nr:purine-nucleoside phosphorylase [Bryobacteraceae bacterium]